MRAFATCCILACSEADIALRSALLSIRLQPNAERAQTELFGYEATSTEPEEG